MKFVGLSIIPLFAVALNLGDSCSPSSQRGQDAPVQGNAVEITTVSPRFVDIPRAVKSEGEFMASEVLNLKANLAATVSKVYVNEGDRVAAEDPLCLFKSDSLNAELEKKQAELKEAEALLEQIQRLMELNGGVLPTSPNADFDEAAFFLDDELPDAPVPPKNNEPAKNEPVDLTKEEKPAEKMDPPSRSKFVEAKIERIHKEIDQLELTLQNLTLKAPIGGIIQKKHVAEGANIVVGDPLFTVVSLDPITLSFRVPQDVSYYVDKMIKVQASPIEAPDQKKEGAIFFISPTIDKVSKDLEIRIHLPNEDGRIREGQKGIAWLTTRRVDKELVLPREVLVTEGEQNFVFVVMGKKVKKTPVTLKEKLGDKEIILDANLRIDDLIVNSGLAKLKDESYIQLLKNPFAETQKAAEVSNN